MVPSIRDTHDDIVSSSNDISVIVVGTHSLMVFDLVEVLRHPVLTTVFILCLSRQVVDHLTCQPDVGHGVEYGSIKNVVANPHDLPVEARLYSVDVVSFP